MLMYNFYKGLTINDLVSGPLSAVRLLNRLLRASLVTSVPTNCRRGVLAVGYDKFLSVLPATCDHMHGVIRVVN